MIRRQQRSQSAEDAAGIDRLQLRALVVEQQLSLIRLYKIHQDHLLCKAGSTPPPNPKTGADIVPVDGQNDRCPNPDSLMRYQEASLSQTTPSRSEAEDVAKVQGIAVAFCDILLERWTRLSEMKSGFAELEDTSHRKRMLTAPLDPRQRFQQPTVESDSEVDTDDRPHTDFPKSRPGVADPVLVPMGEAVERGLGITPPEAIPPLLRSPAINLQPPGISPRSWSSSSPTTPFFPSSPISGRTTRRSSGPSPLSSPRSSFSNSLANDPQRPATAFKTGSPATSNAPAVQPPQPPGLGIPWRLRLRDVFWDHVDNTCTNANTSRSPTNETLRDHAIATEILERYVRREALDELALNYMSVKRELTDSNRRTQFEKMWVIHRGLTAADVQRLARRTQDMDRQDREHYNRRYGHGHGHGRNAPLHPHKAKPSLDRSHTAPAPAPLHIPTSAAPPPPSPQTGPYGSYHSPTHRPPPHRSPASAHSPRSSRDAVTFSSCSSSSDDNDDDGGNAGSGSDRHRSGSRTKSTPGSRRGSGRYHDDRERKKKEGGSLGGSLAKYGLAGVGVTTLLEGLPELLAGL